MKPCSTCQEWKHLNAFNAMRRSGDGRQARCRDCCKAWYAANSEQHKANVAERRQRERRALQARVAEYLRGHPCVDCGETDVRCLEFDHRPDEVKLANVGDLLRRPSPWRVIEAEIARCDVRCANCHRRSTAERGRSWRQVYWEELNLP